MATNYGQPPRAKPRLCFGNAFFFSASGEIILQFRTGEIYAMPNAGAAQWNELKTAVARGKFYNFNVRHVWHAGGKTKRIGTLPTGWSDSF